MQQDTLSNTLLFFQKAVPNPTPRNIQTQLAVHIEEVAEMLNELYSPWDSAMNKHIQEAINKLNELQIHMKKSVPSIEVCSRKMFLDSICDQLVTGTGSAYMLNMNPVGGLSEVNRSNFSKFVDGEPIFDENMKVQKGPNYSPPDLSPFI